MMSLAERAALLRCLRCASALRTGGPGLVCPDCGRSYAVVEGVPVMMEGLADEAVWQAYFKTRAETLGDSEAAQDVVQETFIQVARFPRRLLEIESCHNWLLRVVRNLGVSRIRRDSRARRHVEAFGAQAGTLPEPVPAGSDAAVPSAAP